MHGEILLDRQRPAERRRGHASGLLGTAGDRRGLGCGRPPRFAWRRNGCRGDRRARPRGEAGPLRPDVHAYLTGDVLNLIVLECVEIDHHAHDVRLELRVADVLDAAAIQAVVQRGRRGETHAREIDDEAGGIGEREVCDLGAALHVDDDVDFAAGRQDTDPAHLPVANRRPGKGPGNGGREQGRKEQQSLHGVSSCLASDNVSCRSNPNSCTVNTTSRGRICVTFRRPTMSPAFTR